MAFSTQRAFQHVPFLNEYPQPICPPMEGIKLKTYASSRDERSWCKNDKKKAQYLIDLVSCRLYNDDAIGDGQKENQTNEFHESKGNSVKSSSPDYETDHKDKQFYSIIAEKDDLKSRLDESEEKLEILKEEKKAEIFNDIKRKISHLRNLSKIDKNDENELLKMLDGLYKDEKAFKDLKVQNTYLRQSVEKLWLRNDSINVPVEPETNVDINYLQNEVNRLRKEVALLKSFDKNSIKKETVSKGSQSFDHLHDTDSESLDTIKAERNALKEKCENFASVEGKIIEWKNEAEQFKSFRKKACLALKQKDEVIQDCRERIEEVEYEFKEMIKCFKTKEQDRDALCLAYDCLKEENQHLKGEICRFSCDLKGITVLQNQVQLLSNELCEKNCAIEQYDMQFQQLLGVIEGLQNKATVDICSLQDADSQTHNEHIEELAATTRATLNQISKELEHRRDLEADLVQSRAELETIRRESQEKERSTQALLNAKDIENQKLKENLQKTSIAVKQSLEQLNLQVNPNEKCCVEVERLKELVIKIKSEYENEKELLKKKSTDLMRDLEHEKMKGSDVESVSDDSNFLKISLAAAEDTNRQLQSKNQDLNDALEECQKKIKSQQEEIQKMDQRTTELLCSSEASIKEVSKLVNDINNVQDRNENLKSVLEAVDYSDKFNKEIKDIKKLLDDEIKNSRSLEEQNKILQKNLDEAKGIINSQKAVTVSNNQTLRASIKKSDAQETRPSDALALPIPTPPIAKKSSTEAVDYSDKFNKEIEDIKKLLDDEIKNSRNLEEQNKILQKNLDEAKGIINSQKAATVSNNQTLRASIKKSDAQETRPSDALALPIPTPPSPKKSSTKFAQLEKIHEATRNAERVYYEKEIEGHRLSNKLLENSLTKLTSKVQNTSAADFEKEIRSVLDSFAKEICQWRCEKNFKKLTKLQEIGKKILEHGINCLAYKELLYLHQKISEAAFKLESNCLSSRSSRKELMCCNCSGKICKVPTVPKDNKFILEKLSILEHEIKRADEFLRRSKEAKESCTSDVDQTDLDTLRANYNQINRMARKGSSKPKSSHYSYKRKEEEFEIPTKDRCG